MKREELLKVAKAMAVNLEVAKTMDRKTQTRRVATSSYGGNIVSPKLYETGKCYFHELNNGYNFFIKTKYKVGDILWVREPARVVRHTVDCEGNFYGTIVEYLSDGKQFDFDANEDVDDKKWFQNCQGIPNGCIKEMARTFLKVTNVRVERLQDISEFDIHNEGIRCPIPNMWSEDKRREYKKYEWKQLWNRTAKIGYLWEDNPYVFVYEFEKVEVLG